MFATGNVWDYWPVLVRGFGMTVAISTVAMLLGLLAGALLGTARTYGPGAVRLFCKAYTEAFRSTPPLLLFFGAYYGLSYATGLKLTPFEAAVIALTLEASALLSEAVRGALQSVGSGQWDAARALGLRFGPTLARVVLPQAARVLSPPAVGIFIAVLKDSSFASIVGLVELTRAGLLVRETTGESLRVFLLLASAYLVLNAAVSAIGHTVERSCRTGYGYGAGPWGIVDHSAPGCSSAGSCESPRSAAIPRIACSVRTASRTGMTSISARRLPRR